MHVPGYTYDPVLERYVRTQPHTQSPRRWPGGVQLGAMGDWICTEGDCKIGKAAIDQMLQFFAALKAKNQHKSFEPAVEAIYASYEKQEKQLSRHVPFSTVCCAIKEIGKQAQEVTQQMAAATGSKAPPGTLPKPQPTDWGGIALKLGIGAGAFWLLLELIRSRRATTVAAG